MAAGIVLDVLVISSVAVRLERQGTCRQTVVDNASEVPVIILVVRHSLEV